MKRIAATLKAALNKLGEIHVDLASGLEMRMLVVTSCTDSKAVAGCPGTSMCSEADFDDQFRLRRREAELEQWMLPACRMYTGQQHVFLMSGVSMLRSQFGRAACDVVIVSAGYGVISEDRRIAPYDVTFNRKTTAHIRARGEKLGIPSAIREATAGYTVVALLLGDDYLKSIRPPLAPCKGQRLLAFGSPRWRACSAGDAVVVVPASHKQASEWRTTNVPLKGKMFRSLAAALCLQPSLWPDLHQTLDADLVQRLLQAGRNVP